MKSSIDNQSTIIQYPDIADFIVVLSGIIFDKKTKKILIGKRIEDAYIPSLTWAYPGGRPKHEEELEDAIKRRIKENTGLDVKSWGIKHAWIRPDKRDLLQMYYFCELVGGQETIGTNFTKMKWVEPEEVERYFNTPHDKKLIEKIIKRLETLEDDPSTGKESPQEMDGGERKLKEKTITLESVVHALEDAKLKNYEPLRQNFEQNYEATSQYIVRAYVKHPDKFNIQDDARKEGGFLGPAINFSLVGHEHEDKARKYLANMLSIVPPNRFIHSLQIATYSLSYALGPLVLSQQRAFELADLVTYKLFGQSKEKYFKELLNIN